MNMLFSGIITTGCGINTTEKPSENLENKIAPMVELYNFNKDLFLWY